MECNRVAKLLSSTVGTDASEDETCCSEAETVGQLHLRYGQMVKAIGAMTMFAEEVQVLIIVNVGMFCLAYFIARAIASAFNDMNKVVLTERGQCPENV